MKARPSAIRVRFKLAAFFRRNGYIREQDPSRLRREGHERYKKGDEIRFVANGQAELRLIRGLLREAGFRPGKPFAKGRQYRLPLYGKDEVTRFFEWIAI